MDYIWPGVIARDGGCWSIEGETVRRPMLAVRMETSTETAAATIPEAIEA